MQNGKSLLNAKYDLGELKVQIKGEIDHHLAKPLREEIDKNIFMYRPKILTFDMQKVGFMDSSGLGLIVGRADLCEKNGCKIRLYKPNREVMKILSLCGIEKIKVIEIINESEKTDGKNSK